MLPFLTAALLILGWAAYDTTGFRIGGHVLLISSVISCGFAFWDRPAQSLRGSLLLLGAMGTVVALTHSPAVGAYILGHGLQPYVVRWFHGRGQRRDKA